MPNEPDEEKDNPTVGKITGETINFAHYERFQDSDAKPSDLESLIAAERHIAETEARMGRDWMKIAGAIVIIAIGLSIALFILKSEGFLSGGGGGGGGGGSSIPAMIKMMVKGI